MKKSLWYTRMGVDMIIAAMLLSGCQQNPNSSIVVNKDMDHLIEEAKKSDESSVDMAHIADAYETYQTTLSDESLEVTVNVDAKVDIPEVEQMSIFRVRQQKISQEFLDKIIGELAQGQTLYDAGVTLNTRTRKVVEEEISGLKAEIETIKANYGEEEVETYMPNYQQDIDALQSEYENAPAEIVWEGNESDGLLHSVAEMVEKEGGEEFYQWEYSLNPKGEVYYGANDGENGDYMSVFVQNNEERGNCLRYRRGKRGYDFTATAIVPSTVFDNIATGVWPADEDRAAECASAMYGGQVELVEFTDESTTISEDEARETADTFLKNVGLDDTYRYYEGGLYSEVRDIRVGDDTETEGYRKLNIFRYMRYADGVFVTFDAKSKHEEGWNGDDYVKKDLPVECVEIRVNDSGIVGFDYNAPLEVTETVVDQSNMKPFNEIKDTFEKMVTIANAKSDSESDLGVTVQIDRVVLGYARISEADSYDTGLLVPVWDFEGKVTNEYGQENAGSIMTINAIDGSIIDRSLGY